MQASPKTNQSVTAEIPYTVNTGENLVNETFGPNNIRRRGTGTHELRRMCIRNGRARFTPHTSFEDPQAPPGAPPRQSIEARALAFFAS